MVEWYAPPALPGGCTGQLSLWDSASWCPVCLPVACPVSTWCNVFCFYQPDHRSSFTSPSAAPLAKEQLLDSPKR